MSTFDTIEFFMFANSEDGSIDEKVQEEQNQEKYIEMMYMHQLYNGIIQKQQYVLRGSILSCSYGTSSSLMDAVQDHGIYKGNLPVLTTIDSGKSNICDFGSCLCPESNYMGLLPMTTSERDGRAAIKSAKNEYAHICIPMVPEGSVWNQVDSTVFAKTCAKGYAPLLLDNARLVCQYGGIIRVAEVPQTNIITRDPEDFESDLRSQGFTDCYIKHLMKLHEKYPNWKFEAINTSVDYEQFVNYQVSKKCKCAELDQNPKYCTTAQFKGEDSNNYYVANKDAIQYFSHPYSMLYTDDGKTYENAMQFLKAKQKIPRSYTDAVVSGILSNMSQDVIDKIKNYSGSINPVFLACVLAAETGPNGESHNGKLVYNLFNFGAVSGRESGKKYAYDKGWFSLNDCINACEAEFSTFFNRGQDTLYSLDWHFHAFGSGGDVKQYATLVNDAENKAIMMAKRNSVQFDLDQEFVFAIPVYQNISTYNNQPCEPYPDPNW